MTHQTVGHAPEDALDGRRCPSADVPAADAPAADAPAADGFPAQGALADCPDGTLVPPAGAPHCPVDVTLAALAGRWTPLVLREFLRRGRATYSELSAALPALSDKVLSDRLAQLTRVGVIERHRIPGWPPRVRYVLTGRGRALEPVVHSMWEWGSAQDAPWGSQAAGSRQTPVVSSVSRVSA
ncbi:winged helix-turn-helix transcriptional regulator [Streptomyces sp. NPDC058874]|uniref:winged helix-turn-helix transcriptional regulator n=1 Tax=unclassified Streptomyces TaxID=2593676 RepID=UPI00368FCEA2